MRGDKKVVEFAELRYFQYPIDNEMQQELDKLEKKYVLGNGIETVKQNRELKYRLNKFIKLSLTAFGSYGAAIIGKSYLDIPVSIPLVFGTAYSMVILKDVAEHVVKNIKQEVKTIFETEEERENHIRKVLRLKVDKLDKKWRATGKVPNDAPPLYFNMKLE